MNDAALLDYERDQNDLARWDAHTEDEAEARHRDRYARRLRRRRPHLYGGVSLPLDFTTY